MAKFSTNFQKQNDFRNYLLDIREPVCYDCEGCNRVDSEDKSFCGVYIKPEVVWSRGGCFLATHVKTEEEKKKERVRVGQQKQKKKH